MATLRFVADPVHSSTLLSLGAGTPFCFTLYNPAWNIPNYSFKASASPLCKSVFVVRLISILFSPIVPPCLSLRASPLKTLDCTRADAHAGSSYHGNKWLKSICWRCYVESCQRQINKTKQRRESFDSVFQQWAPCDSSVAMWLWFTAVEEKMNQSVMKTGSLMCQVLTDWYYYWLLSPPTCSYISACDICCCFFGCRFMFDKLINGVPLPDLSLVINSNELFHRIKSISLAAIYGSCFLTVPGCCINI